MRHVYLNGHVQQEPPSNTSVETATNPDNGHCDQDDDLSDHNNKPSSTIINYDRSQSSAADFGNGEPFLLNGGNNNRRPTQHQPVQKRISALLTAGGGGGDGTSQKSFNLQQNNLIQSVKKSLAKTKRQWDRSGFIHVIYVVVLLVYSFLGGGVFMALDGPHADQILANYSRRCSTTRDRAWLELETVCANRSFADCTNRTLDFVKELDLCFRSTPPPPFNHTTSDYWNSLIYAITVFTTIGYGNVVVTSTGGRLAMIVYAMIGIPLFFAFLNDMGQWFHFKFLRIYYKSRRKWKFSRLRRFVLSVISAQSRRASNVSALSMDSSAPGGDKAAAEAERDSHDGLIFTFAVGVLIFYLIIVCCLFMVMVHGKWSFFQAFYFLFQSISLIGFGDEFPDDPNFVLINITFIIIGIILLSMCFFVLQEWIRGKTYRLSSKFRRSVRRFRQYRSATTTTVSTNRQQPENGETEMVTGQSARSRNSKRPSARFTVPLARRLRRRFGSDRLKTAKVISNDKENLKSPIITQKCSVTSTTTESNFCVDESAVILRPSRPEPKPHHHQGANNAQKYRQRRDGVRSVDENLAENQLFLDDDGRLIIDKNDNQMQKIEIAASESSNKRKRDDVSTKSQQKSNKRQFDRRHTVIALEEMAGTSKNARNSMDDSTITRKRGKTNQQQHSSSSPERQSYQAARFGKFQWTRDAYDEDDDEEEYQDEKRKGKRNQRVTVTPSNSVNLQSSPERDDFL